MNREARSLRGSQAPAFISPFALKCKQALTQVAGMRRASQGHTHWPNEDGKLFPTNMLNVSGKPHTFPDTDICIKVDETDLLFSR